MKQKSILDQIQELLAAGYGNVKEAIQEPGKFHARALGNLRRQIEENPEEVGMNWTGGGLGGMTKMLSKSPAEAQAAYKAQFTPGFYHSSPKSNIEAFDPNAPARHMDELSEYGSRGATFFTKDPKFAETFLPLKSLAIKNQYEKGATMYPVSLNLGKHFNPTTPESFQILKEYTKDPSLLRWLSRADWSTMERPSFMDFLKKKGYDTFMVKEGNIENIGVFNPKNIRGKFAEYNPEYAESPEFMKAEGGLIHLR